MDTKYTRTIEYAHLPNQDYNGTKLLPKMSVLYHETSGDEGEPYYPVPNPRNQDLYKKYQEMAGKEKDVVFVGRLASYKYFDMDDATRNALNVFNSWAENQDILRCDLTKTKPFML
jgi:UDP-galactopyranose mutase